MKDDEKKACDSGEANVRTIYLAWGSGNRRTTCGALIAMLWAVALAPARGQEPGDPPVNPSRTQVFYIPFGADVDRRLKSVQLYVSTDQGRSWQPAANAHPQDGRFLFTAPADGLYWFAVRTIDLDNRAYPLIMENIRPGLKVLVDTLPPKVALRPQQPRDGYSGVEWEVQDENLDLGSLALDYRLQGAPEWIPLRAEPVAAGRQSWRPGVNGTLEVRLRARDKAGNEGEAKTTVLAASDSRFASETNVSTSQSTTTAPAAGNPLVKLVNSKRVCFEYELQGKGPSGVSLVELWYTQDGRTWQKYKEERNPQPPLCVEVNDEGIYGFTLLAKSGVGLGDQPPHPGDTPQVWVEVDLTKPVVRLRGVDVGRGADAGNVTITWVATDKNLGRQPITLSYAAAGDNDQPSGPWVKFAPSIENRGTYVWRKPEDVPYKFFVRIEAVDKAGNVGVDQSASAVIVDLSQPRVIIREVAPKN